MTDDEIRIQVQRAIGDHAAPAGLQERAYGRLLQGNRDDHAGPPRLVGFVAAALALLIIVGLTGYRLSVVHQRAVPGSSPAPQQSAKPSPALPEPPDAVLAIASLGQATSLVTPFDLSATSGGITLKLIGAYADTARTVVILEADPAVLPFDGGEMDDSAGLMPYASGMPVPTAPYAIYAVDGPPKSDPDGLAHIHLTFTQLVDRVQPGPGSTGSPPSHAGHWEFAFAIPVRPSQSLSVASSTLAVGGVPVTLETVEATPSVIHVQALVTAQGQTVMSAPNFLQLLDSSGQPLIAVAAVSGVTVPKQKLTPQNANIVRLNYQWARSVAGGAYVIRFRYQGATMDTPVTVPALGPTPHAAPTPGMVTGDQAGSFCWAQGPSSLRAEFSGGSPPNLHVVAKGLPARALVDLAWGNPANGGAEPVAEFQTDANGNADVRPNASEMQPMVAGKTVFVSYYPSGADPKTTKPIPMGQADTC